MENFAFCGFSKIAVYIGMRFQPSPRRAIATDKKLSYC